MSPILNGWRIIFRLLLFIVRRLARWIAEFFERARGKGEKGGRRDYRDVCCLHLPPTIRARPDPYVYSQQWLASRGLAITWDNPDFRLIDVTTGTIVPPNGLLPDHAYDVEVTVHNNSFMAAIHTTVGFEVRGFGAGTSTVSALGITVVDVPGAGTAVARQRWHTPRSGGHHCLIVTLTHVDDANPLNNVGQHNTDVAAPASPSRRLTFGVRNSGLVHRVYQLVMDGYQLPERGRCAETHRERRSLRHLRALQAANDPRKFPVPGFLRARLSTAEVSLRPGEEATVTFECEPPARGQGTQRVNVHVTDGDMLVGGVTAIVLEEGT